MFYPQEMTEIELIVPERDVLAVTSVLANRGIFHQVDASYIQSETGLDSPDDWRAKSAAYAALERRILSAMKALDIDERMPHVDDLTSMVEIDSVRSAAQRLEEEVGETVDSLAQAQGRVEQLATYIQQLEKVSAADVDIGTFRNFKYAFAMLGVIPNDHIERLETSMERIPFALLILRKEPQRSIALLLGTQRNADVLERAARSAYLNPLHLPDSHSGTPSQIIKALYADIAEEQQRIQDRRGQIAELQQAREKELQAWLWRVRASRMLANAVARLGRLRYTYLIVGWVPVSHLNALTRQLDQVSKDIVIEINRSERRSAEQNVPVSLRNPGPFHAFQQLVTTYGRPRYQEVDPTFLMALTFPILFGAMFGDVGHGLVLALLGGLLASRKVPALRGLADLGVVIAICGVAAMIFGFLYGSIFGFEHVLPVLWIRPMEDIMHILGVAIGAGVVLLSVGFVIGILNAWIAKDWSRLLFSHNGVAGLVLYWSLLGMAAGVFLRGFPVPTQVFVALAVVSGVAVTFAELLGRLIEGHRPLIQGGIATYAVQAFFELFETLISFLSNSLSYVRVGAFAVAHGGLSAVIFILAEMLSPTHGTGYWIVVALGNLFIIGFEGLIVGIQTLRLEYYEFFSKFFRGGGVVYTPLTTLPKAGE